ncbi:ComEC/Rec2 family competence protein, partial [Patescibacteria group bacterium]|nr:ComEC/Rec2 family competence protein [Patescibacteria group bacterium]
MPKKLVLLIILLIIALSGRLVYLNQNESKYNNLEQVTFESTLLSDPKFYPSSQVFYLNQGFNRKIKIITTRYPEFKYGQTIAVSGKLKLKMLKNNKTELSMYLPKIKAGKREPIFPIFYTSSFRERMIDFFQKTLPPTSSSLLLGIVFGIKKDMPSSFVDSLRSSGVMHVIAASGMNVAMVGSFLSYFLIVFVKRQAALLLTIAGIVFYALLSGAEPSIVRASIMGIFAFSAQIIGRQSLAFFNLFLAGYIMVFFSPNLLFDIGFQLSFASTLGLLYIPSLLKTPSRKLGILEDAVTTVSSQVVTLPILFANFGAYSVLSIFANLLVLWTVPILMLLGAVGIVFYA